MSNQLVVLHNCLDDYESRYCYFWFSNENFVRAFDDDGDYEVYGIYKTEIQTRFVIVVSSLISDLVNKYLHDTAITNTNCPLYCTVL